MSADPFDLARFLSAQAGHFEQALKELRDGPKANPLDLVRLPAA
jgi:uncharacterized protein (DUF1810 family)